MEYNIVCNEKGFWEIYDEDECKIAEKFETEEEAWEWLDSYLDSKED